MVRLTIQQTCMIEACGSEHTCDIFGNTHSITGEQFTQQLEHPIEIIPTFWAFTGRVWQIVNAHELNKKHPEAEARAEITYHVNSLKRDGKI